MTFMKLLVNLINLPVAIVKREDRFSPEIVNFQRELMEESANILEIAGP